MSKPKAEQDTEVDPVEFLRAALALSPEDAERVREDAAEKMKDGAAVKD